MEGRRARLLIEALKAARSAYFSTLLEENKHNPRYLQYLKKWLI